MVHTFKVLFKKSFSSLSHKDITLQFVLLTWLLYLSHLAIFPFLKKVFQIINVSIKLYQAAFCIWNDRVIFYFCPLKWWIILMECLIHSSFYSKDKPDLIINFLACYLFQFIHDYHISLHTWNWPINIFINCNKACLFNSILIKFWYCEYTNLINVVVSAMSWFVSHQNSYFAVLTLSSSECDLIWGKGLYRGS